MARPSTCSELHSGTSTTARSNDYWIDAHSKQLLGYTDLGAHVFDPETDPDRDHSAEKEFSTGKMLGSVTSNIVFDATLAADLFNLTPPAGYEIVKEPLPPPISEAEIIEWLGAHGSRQQRNFPRRTQVACGLRADAMVRDQSEEQARLDGGGTQNV